jgi:hypothetical protein
MTIQNTLRLFLPKIKAGNENGFKARTAAPKIASGLDYQGIRPPPPKNEASLGEKKSAR